MKKASNPSFFFINYFNDIEPNDVVGRWKVVVQVVSLSLLQRYIKNLKKQNFLIKKNLGRGKK